MLPDGLEPSTYSLTGAEGRVGEAPIPLGKDARGARGEEGGKSENGRGDRNGTVIASDATPAHSSDPESDRGTRPTETGDAEIASLPAAAHTVSHTVSHPQPPDGATVELEGETWVCLPEWDRARWQMRIGEGATMGGSGPVFRWLDSALTALWRERESKRPAPMAPEERAQLVCDLRRDINEVADAAMVYGMSLAGGVDSAADRNANRASVDAQILWAFERLDRLHTEADHAR